MRYQKRSFQHQLCLGLPVGQKYPDIRLLQEDQQDQIDPLPPDIQVLNLLCGQKSLPKPWESAGRRGERFFAQEVHFRFAVTLHYEMHQNLDCELLCTEEVLIISNFFQTTKLTLIMYIDSSDFVSQMAILALF